MEMKMEETLRAYRAVASETRLNILIEISKKKDGLSFGQLRDKLKLNSNALDYHLEKLAEAKLIANILRTPVTRRAGLGSESGITTLSTSKEQSRKPVVEKHYSYYQVTDFGKEMLTKIGIG